MQLSRHYAHEAAGRVALLTGAAALLYLAGGVGMAYVAGFDAVHDALVHPVLPWLAASAAAVALAFVGYYFAYRGVATAEGGADDLDTGFWLAIVAAGFGGFLAQGGTALDEPAFRAAGAGAREARVRVALLAGLEHGILAIPGSIAAIVFLVEGARKPPTDFTYPWAIAPALGFAIAFWAARRYRGAFRGRGGWRGRVSVLLDMIELVRRMFAQPRRHAGALGGMLLFWLCDMFGLWAAFAVFRFQMNFGAVAIGLGTAMIVTRRTGPLGGAGIMMVALPPTLWQCGAPWPQAVLATFTYRFFTLWLPLPFSLYAIPRVRAILDRAGETAAERDQAAESEPALRR